jgi:hypothetical protein
MTIALGLFSSPYDALGKIYRIKHYNRHDVSIPRLMRRHWIVDTPQNKREPVAYFTVGEGTLVQNIEEALRQNYIVEMVTGPRLRDATIRDRLAELLEKYGPDRLKIFTNSERPQKHSALINNNILFEDFHPANLDYDEATVIENADAYNIDLLVKHFNQLKTSINSQFMQTPAMIRNLPVF